MNHQQAPAISSNRVGTSLETFVDRGPTTAAAWFDHRGHNELFTRFALTFERLGELTGKCGLDIGCGSGPYLTEAMRRGAARMVGIDPAPGMLELARGRIEAVGQLENVSLLEGYFPQTVPDGAFDFAMTIGVLDYVADPLEFLAALRAVLAGTAVVSFPCQHWLHTPIRRIRYRWRNCPVYFFDERRIRGLAREAGFSAVDVVQIDGVAMDYLACLRP